VEAWVAVALQRLFHLGEIHRAQIGQIACR
jgi:hypothetical protein